MKETFKLLFEMAFFVLVSVPIACALYFGICLFYEIKTYLHKYESR